MCHHVIMTNHHAIHDLQDDSFDVVVMYVDINYFLRNVRLINKICKYIKSIGIRYITNSDLHRYKELNISDIVYSAAVNTTSIQRLNGIQFGEYE